VTISGSAPAGATVEAPDPVPDRKPQRGRSARAREDRRTGYALISPTAVIVFTMVILPILWTVSLAFQHVRLLNLRRTGFIGDYSLDNFEKVLTSPGFVDALITTLVYSVAGTACAIGLGLVAALALGCDGINMGTRFMATKEAPIHQNVKERLVSSDERSTSLIFRTLRNTSRVYGNSVAKKAIEMEAEGKTIQEIGPIVSGAKGRVVYETGDMEHGVWSAGTCMGLINDIPSCKELIERIVGEAEAMIKGRLSRAVAA